MGAPPVVHLELLTDDRPGASAFYAALLGWRTERIDDPCGSYHALALGGGIEGGIVECDVGRPSWLPYVEVECVDLCTRRARALGARVPVEPREGPAGWRSVIATPGGAELALWQSKVKVSR